MANPMFERTFRKDDHTMRFTIRDSGSAGWEVRQEQDDAVLTRTVLSDWHRVERARSAFAATAVGLAAAGWTEARA